MMWGISCRTASRLKQLLRSLELETEAQIHAGYRQSAAAQNKDADFDPLEMDQSELQRTSRHWRKVWRMT